MAAYVVEHVTSYVLKEPALMAYAGWVVVQSSRARQDIKSLAPRSSRVRGKKSGAGDWCR